VILRRTLVDRIQLRLDTFLNERASILASISPETEPLQTLSHNFLQTGKKIRAQFCLWGWLSIPDNNTVTNDQTEAIISAAAALEIFHAAALIHDDIIDNSDTRRGLPSAHRHFEKIHSDAEYNGNVTEFGISSAILLGDLMLGWSDELLDEGLKHLNDHDCAHHARQEFNLMRTQVTAGQYLDILEERAWVTQNEDQLLSRAERVVIFKSAKYSVEAPLLVGATMNGANEHQLATLRSFGLPVGVAFQLRDDLLGVFGDPQVTGKPSGDDLRQGKRTILVALARKRVSAEERQEIDAGLGNPSLSVDEISHLQNIIYTSGAVDVVEKRIENEVSHALDKLQKTKLTTHAVEQLRNMAVSVARRSA
jgi:geranylgeranyl diphosphate synthase type I